MKQFYYLIITVIFLLAGTYSLAQDCAQALRLARAIYDQGRLQEVETYLRPCFSEKTGTVQKDMMVEAYKLMCLSHIYLEEPDKADEDMLNIKKTDPYYRPNEGVDPAEFIALYKTYREEPVFRIGATLGVNFSRPNIEEATTITEVETGSKYVSGIGIQLGAALDKPLKLFGNSAKWTLHSELMIYQLRSFKLTQIEERINPLTNEIKRNQLNGREQHLSFTAPIMLHYQYKKIKTFSLYAGAGLTPEWLVSRNIAIEKIREDQPSVPEKNYELTNNTIQLSASLATGIKLPIKPGIVVAEIRYNHGLTRITNQSMAYQNNELAFDHGYADSVFKISSVMFKISYLYEKFIPKKNLQTKR